MADSLESITSSCRITFFADQRDEAASDLMHYYRSSLLLGDELEELCFGRTDGDAEASAFAQLTEEGLRELGCSRRNDDAVEGCSVGQASASVSDLDGEVGVSQAAQNVARPNSEFGMTFNGIDMLAQLREQCGLVSGAGPDFENYFFLSQSQKFQHKRDNIGLRDGLGLADGKWIVVIGLLAIRLGYKFVARDTGHRSQDTLVPDSALAELGLNHLLAADGVGVVGGRFQKFQDSGFLASSYI